MSMLTSEVIQRYRIDYVTDRGLNSMNHLFSGNEYDPDLAAHYDADNYLAFDSDSNKLPFDVVTAVGPDSTVLTQVIVFRDHEGYMRYLADVAKGIVVFDYRE